MTKRKITVAIVGLGFGAEFIPIYQRHPHANMYAICQRTRKKLDAIGDAFGVERRHDDFHQLLKDPELDAVHNNSPIPDHAPQSLAALKAGKHVACTVPMGTGRDEIRALVEQQRKSGKVYMMMETVVYSREYLFVKDLYDRGELGRIQFLRGSHQQDENEEPVIHTKSTPEKPLAEPEIPKRVKAPDFAQLLPEPIRRFTQPAQIVDAEHLSFLQGGGHGGSHPHLAHNFLMAVLGEQPAFPDAPTSANWTMVGLCAHESAMKGGDRVAIPMF